MAKKKKGKTKKSSAVDTGALRKLLDLLTADATDEAEDMGQKFGFVPDEFQRLVSDARQVLEKGPDPREIAKLPPVFQMAFVLFAEKDDDDDLIVDLLEISGDKAVKKEAKRALHKMRSRGIDVSVPSSGGSILDRMVEEEQKPLACQISPVASDGTMVLLLAKTTRGGVGIYQAVINDEDGLMEFQGGVIGRKQYRRIDQSISQEEKDKLLDIPYERARAILSEAADRSRAKGKPLPEKYLDASTDLGPVEKSDGQDQLPEDLKLDTRQDQLLSQAERLLSLDEFEEWIPSEDIMKLIQEKIEEVEQSKIIVGEQQRIEQIERAFDAGVKMMLEDKEKRIQWNQRLLTNARFLLEKGKEEEAKIAASVAWQLLDEEFEATSSVFFNKLARKIFSPADQIAAAMTNEFQEEEDKEEDPGNIILTP